MSDLIQLFGDGSTPTLTVVEVKPEKPMAFLPLSYAFDFDEMDGHCIVAETAEGDMFEVAAVWEGSTPEDMIQTTRQGDATQYARLFAAAPDMQKALRCALAAELLKKDTMFSPEPAVAVAEWEAEIRKHFPKHDFDANSTESYERFMELPSILCVAALVKASEG